MLYQFEFEGRKPSKAQVKKCAIEAIKEGYPLISITWGENWISLDNPSLTLTKRIERWLELVKLASDLGYTMPRVQHHVARFIKFLTLNKKKNKKIYAITSG